jgi:hypothetical protein
MSGSFTFLWFVLAIAEGLLCMVFSKVFHCRIIIHHLRSTTIYDAAKADRDAAAEGDERPADQAGDDELPILQLALWRGHYHAVLPQK